MRRITWLVAAAATAVGLTQLLPLGDAQASGVDLSMTGSVVANVATVKTGQEIAFEYTLTNHSSTVKTQVFIIFTVTIAGSINETSNYICPAIGTRLNINTDGDFCEPGNLGPGKSTGAAAEVTVPLSAPVGSRVAVKACVDDGGLPDPTPGNNCKTVSVPVA